MTPFTDVLDASQQTPEEIIEFLTIDSPDGEGNDEQAEEPESGSED